MDDPSQLIEQRLGRLTLATQDIRPSPGFEQRVLTAVTDAIGIDWLAGLWRLGRYGLVASLVAVTLATIFAVRGASRADEMQAMTYGTVDFEW